MDAFLQAFFGSLGRFVAGVLIFAIAIIIIAIFFGAL